MTTDRPDRFLPAGDGLVASVDREDLDCIDATHIVRDGHKVVGAAFGLLTVGEAQNLVHRLRTHDDPGKSAPDTPWAAVAMRARGGVVATASTMLQSGLFYCVDGPGRARLTLATDPGSLVSHRPVATVLSEDFIRDFAMLNSAPEATPYVGVARLPVGFTLRWNANQPLRTNTVAWIGPSCWGEPDLSGVQAVDDYRNAFDEVVADLIPRVGPLTSHVSGGLDSTFVTATLARLVGERDQILALNHVPHPDADLHPEGNWDPDDSQAARSLLSRYPKTLRIQPVVNDRLIQPLDSASEAARLAWWPTYNPGNQTWINETNQVASDRGSAGLFVGATGNASFSPDAAYAALYHARKRELRQLVSIARLKADSGWSRRQRLRRHLLAPLAAPMRPRRPFSTEYLKWIGIGHETPPTAHGERYERDMHLSMIVGNEGALSAALHPAASKGVLTIDPFQARTVMDVAARIVPAEWLRGPAPRGFARLVGADRVPDQIRLRTRKGGQAWDTWYVIHDQRDRYESEIDELDETPILTGWVDAAAVRAQMRMLPWGDPSGRGSLPLMGIQRILSLAGFIRTTQASLRDLVEP